jgi:predicted Zn-dependent protease
MTSGRAMREAALGVVLAVGFTACATVPYTHRSQLLLLDEAQMNELGVQAYQQVLQKADVVRDPHVNAVVRDVGGRIAAAADKPDYHWEFSVIDDPRQVNAFALPGGKVAVYTGLFPVARDEAGLAVVLGHEVAHALAHHGAERMSQEFVAQLVGTGLSVALGSASPATQGTVMQAFGLGAHVGVLLPFSRQQESEADHIGLILMAKAGYDPSAAVGLWQRMESRTGAGQAPPDFLSTHPSYGTRLKDIRSWIPEARRYLTDPVEHVQPLPRAD